MRMTKDYLENFSNESGEMEIFSQIYSFLIQEGFFSILQDGDCQSFHEKIYEIVKYPHGLGIALCISPIVNVAGTILLAAKENGSSIAEKVLNKISNGEIIPAVAISEENWQGRLSKIKTTLIQNNSYFVLNGKKSFVTNSHPATHILVVAKENEKHKVVLVPKMEKGIFLESFFLSFAKEATHAKINFENVVISPEWILPLDYSTWGERARLSEMFTLAYILNSYIRTTTHKLIQIALERGIWKNDFQVQKNTFELFQVLDMQKLYLTTITKERSGKNFLMYPLENKYPFGLSIIIQSFLNFWKNAFSKETFIEMFPDSQILFLNQIEEDYNFKKAVRSFFQHLFQITGEQFIIEI